MSTLEQRQRLLELIDQVYELLRPEPRPEPRRANSQLVLRCAAAVPLLLSAAVTQISALHGCVRLISAGTVKAGADHDPTSSNWAGHLRYNVSQIVNKESVMAATSMVHVRVDERLKTQATETLAAMGLSVSDAVRVFLTRVVAEQQLPFALKAPNADTRAAMDEARAISKARFASAKESIVDLEKGGKR